MIIAIDGPAGAGKSTVAKELARRLGYLYIDTGAMYRAVAWQALRDGLALEDTERISRIAEQLRIELAGSVDDMQVIIGGVNISGEIRTPQVSQAASIVSAIPAVRRALVARQQEMGRVGNVVMEGRDIGTVVFPGAEAKFYLDASTEARAQRRFSEDRARGVAVKSLDAMQQEIESRDRRDKTRDDSPLTQAPDAIHIDSSEATADQVVEQILSIVQTKLAATRS
ncbi:MAG TPA: (d)CMP kinase [Blastocatellia bacterium]|nr:(d)CMP kinase [Blastocatellia bacterium]